VGAGAGRFIGGGVEIHEVLAFLQVGSGRHDLGEG
jgi:thymidine phosphorylase